MMFFFLARGIKSPKPKPLIRIPDSVMTPYNAQVLIIQIKCQKKRVHCKFYILQLYRQYSFFIYLVRQLYSFLLRFGLCIYQQQ